MAERDSIAPFLNTNRQVSSVMDSVVTFDPPGTPGKARDKSIEASVFNTPTSKRKEIIKKFSLGDMFELENGTENPSQDIKMPDFRPIIVACLALTFISTGLVTFAIATAEQQTLAATTSPTFSPTFNPSRSPTLFPSEHPTVSPTPKPTQSPTQNPTLSPIFPFQFSFQTINNLRQICGTNMEPTSAVNGVFFSACANDLAILCKQSVDNISVGVLEEVSCIDSGLVCPCADFVMFPPNIATTASELCTPPEAEVPIECFSALESLEFVDNVLTLEEAGFLNSVATSCARSGGADLQSCLHGDLKIYCENPNVAGNIALEQCVEEGRSCDCTTNVRLFDLFGIVLPIDICDSSILAIIGCL